MDAILAERASRHPETAGSLFAFQTNLSILFGAVGALAKGFVQFHAGSQGQWRCLFFAAILVVGPAPGTPSILFFRQAPPLFH